jgi:hypothetical protein
LSVSLAAFTVNRARSSTSAARGALRRRAAVGSVGPYRRMRGPRRTGTVQSLG